MHRMLLAHTRTLLLQGGASRRIQQHRPEAGRFAWTSDDPSDTAPPPPMLPLMEGARNSMVPEILSTETSAMVVSNMHPRLKSPRAMADMHALQEANRQRCGRLSPLAPNFPADKTVGVAYWLTDLRVHDHYPLALACKKAHELGGLPVVAMLCLDTRAFAQPSQILGCYRMGPQRAAFTLECVASLREHLQEMGVPLVIRVGFPEALLPQLMQQLRCVHCYTSTQYAPHEKVVHDSLINSSHEDLKRKDHAAPACTMHSVWQSTLVHVEDLPTPLAAMQDGFRWFHDDAVLANVRPTRPYACTASMKRLPSVLPFFKAFDSFVRFQCDPSLRLLPGREGVDEDEAGWSGCPAAAGMGPLPTLEDLGYRDVPSLLPTHVIATSSSHSGGESAASERLEDWIAQGGMKSMMRLGHVKRATVKMYSSELLRISPYISTGCMSPRRLYERLKEYAYDNALDGSVHLQFQEALLRLYRRDYWHFFGVRHGPSMFYSYGPKPENSDEAPDWRFDDKILRRWCNGLSGFPFADASMRELLATGWVGDPGRQALMWMLSIGLGQDWRAGAEWMERCSLDFDPFVCYGNSAYVSKLLPDDFGDNVHSLHYLAHKHDQTGIYVKKWLPVLSKVPSVYIHRPHVMTERMQAMHGVHLGKTYPYPVKLWDGAQATMGPSQLTTYFENEIQRRAPGPFEAVAFSKEAMLPLASLHTASGSERYRRVASALLIDDTSFDDSEDDTAVGVLRKPLRDNAPLAELRQEVS